MDFPIRTIKHSFALFTIVAFLTGCSHYSTVSPAAYQYSKALYSICNLRDEPRLADVATRVEAARNEAEISEQEADWLNDIIATAQADAWQDATKMARELMEAQVSKE